MFIQEISSGEFENFVKARLTDNINFSICEQALMLEESDLKHFKENLIYLVKDTRNQSNNTIHDIPDDRKLQGSKAASILTKIDKESLKGADISFCHLPHIDFRDINLTGTNIEQANLNFCIFDKNLFKTIRHEKAFMENSSLYLNDPEFQDFSKLKNLKNLKEIDLSGNTLDNLLFLKEQVNVSHLYLSDNKIKNLSPLKYLKNLIELDLRNNGINALSGLEYLEKLKKLDLSNDLSPSNKMSGSRFNKIIDLSPLKYLKKLENLNLTNNLLDKRQISKLNKALPGCNILC
jgi:Leucine-rich repeat (LRR) protein